MIIYCIYNVAGITMAVTWNLIIFYGTLLEDFYNQIYSSEYHSILCSLEKMYKTAYSVLLNQESSINQHFYASQYNDKGYSLMC